MNSSTKKENCHHVCNRFVALNPFDLHFTVKHKYRFFFNKLEVPFLQSQHIVTIALKKEQKSTIKIVRKTHILHHKS